MNFLIVGDIVGKTGLERLEKELPKLMNERNIDIEDMQCWVFRMAQTRWKMPAKKCAKLFKEYDIWEFIEECYDILHLNSYNCVLNDIEVLLKNKGVTV